MTHRARLFFLVPAALLLLAVLHLPYGYYTFLRLAVAVCAIIAAWVALKAKDAVNWEVVVMGLIAILFNPLAPVWLSRAAWLPIDLAGAAFFAYFALRSDTKAAK
jgi:hypothetical protein